MTDRVSEFTMRKWKSFRPNYKVSPKQWVHANAPCCIHRGESADKRSRGAFKLIDNGIVYNCFNCNLRTKYLAGKGLSRNFKNLLRWIGASDQEIGQLVLEDLRIDTPAKSHIEDAPVSDLNLRHYDLPEGFKTLIDWIAELGDDVTKHTKLMNAINYAVSRLSQDEIEAYNIGYTSVRDIKTQIHNRLIIPYTWNNKIVGYTARALTDNIKPKYFSRIDSDYLFGLDHVPKTSRFLFVTEGVMDAIPIKGVAVLGNTISKVQADIIKRQNKVVVVIPDFEQSGMPLVESAIEYGWKVAFPLWATENSDVSSACAKYGRLYVTKDILSNIYSGKTSIELKMKEYI